MQLVQIHKQILQCLVDDGSQIATELERKTGFAPSSIQSELKYLNHHELVFLAGLDRGFPIPQQLYVVSDKGREMVKQFATEAFMQESADYLAPNLELPVGPVLLTHGTDDKPDDWVNPAPQAPAPTYEAGCDPIPFLLAYQAWRTSNSDCQQPAPKDITAAIDEAIKHINELREEVRQFVAMGLHDNVQTVHGDGECIAGELTEFVTGKFLFTPAEAHPLQKVFDLAILQATKGKGDRHGGDSVPFLAQQWVSLADDYGVGGLYYQANKKLREAQGKEGEARQRELLGSLNYLAMGVLYEMAVKPAEAATNG